MTAKPKAEPLCPNRGGVEPHVWSWQERVGPEQRVTREKCLYCGETREPEPMREPGRGPIGMFAAGLKAKLRTYPAENLASATLDEDTGGGAGCSLEIDWDALDKAIDDFAAEFKR